MMALLQDQSYRIIYHWEADVKYWAKARYSFINNFGLKAEVIQTTIWGFSPTQNHYYVY